MRSGIRTTVCTLALLVIMSSATQADDYTDPGFYVGLGIPLGLDNFDADFDRDIVPLFPPLLSPILALVPTGVGSLKDYSTRPAFGVRIYTGYKIMRYVAVEAEFDWMATRFKTRINGAPLLESRPWTVVGNVKGYILKGRFQPFVRVGAGWMSNDLFMNLSIPLGGAGSTDFRLISIGRNVSGAVVRFGGGIELYGNEHAAVSIDFSYVMPFGDADGFDYWSIGLFNMQYRF